MSGEKQKLECEMAEMLEIIEKARESYANDITDHTENEYIREGLLDAGYRKQGWISVKERLPEEKQFVIVYDTVTECVRFIVYNSGADIWTGNIISHWMPLPEAPKMKGGAE